MYQFTRRVRIAGSAASAIPFSVGMGKLVTKITGQPVSTWSSVFSPGAGTIAWGTFAPDLKTLQDMMDTLQADKTFQAESEKGREMFIPGSMDDGLAQVVHGNPDPSSNPQYVAVVHATCAPGKLVQGMTAGVEIAQHVEKATGHPTMFLARNTGPFGGVTWLTPYDDVTTMERAEQAFYGDSAVLDFIDSATTAYLPDGTQTIFRRLA